MIGGVRGSYEIYGIKVTLCSIDLPGTPPIVALPLPENKENKYMRIAFDVDDTLIVPSVALGFGDNTPNHEVIAIYRWFQAQGCEMVIWSGSGIDWAQRWGEKLGLQPFSVRMKQKSEDIDIAFDDCDVDLAKVNVKVRRINNSVSRADWNKEKK